MIAALAFLAFTLSPCKIESVPGPARCGTYRVWENRETKRGRQTDISVTVLEATTPNRQPDPLVFLQGGPGDAPSFNARFYSRVFANIRETRDLVLIDLRGTGKSAALTCPELSKPDATGLMDENLLNVDQVRACRTRLEQTADLRQYTTEIAVDDLDEIRQALGYKQINLYGTSYGTRVAQVYLRRHPTSVRTVTMKGIVPPSMASPESHASAGEKAWQNLVKRCDDDPACKAAFPNLDTNFRALLKILDNAPVLPLPEPENGVTKVKVTPGLFAEAFRFTLYSPEAAARAPNLVKLLAVDKKELAEIALGARNLLSGERLAAGFFLSVSCTEDIPYLPKNISRLTANSFGGDYRLRQQIKACSVWPKGKVSPQHRRPTTSSVPTLLLSGEFDPVTPPSGGEEVLRGLKNGAHIVIKNNGHPIGTADKCIAAMMSAFINQGGVKGLDNSCAKAIQKASFVTEPSN